MADNPHRSESKQWLARRALERRSLSLRLRIHGTFSKLVESNEFVRIGNVVVAVNDDIRKTLNSTFQIRLSSLESRKKLLVRNVVTALAHAHGDSLD